ncbi:aminoacyl-tRNA hydrolase [Subsaximicrobium wynnwilliamsii]|uniref:Aminoacyl-tRNA hydrolase n=1 Tax=Subsaximicrobium wynnwilliamsii TaxID=291179 RepID=A0A5C6ZIS0_9FLAO|nr:alternative ribosome rescue aminoacyl-tRNA hydrolase ArfB [Subsaximicrobium wynnwilliamsii]TXD83694.1 aminoacyl-tRNA hydrolase [Subsaximicrobium wynnwilliamsii]TXD89422.1 aminoacyl-tRNA hydrolase [Subsaximicrobium wynnwilliamsii]TXE03531.1 aminoacyl-tRNA hydrolase [Subsaximicrobium wynnwilliamsii]
MFDEQAILSELQFKAVRSSGAGGQHVNKTASKVELTFDLENSQFLSEHQKMLLKKNLQSRLTNNIVLMMQCGESRSQHQNKSIIIKRFLDLLKDNLVEEKERIPTKTPKRAKRRRLKNKRIKSEKKANRKPPEF